MIKIKSEIPKDILHSIGLVSLNYKILEQNLEIGIWFLLGVRNKLSIGQIVTADLTFSELIKLIRALHNERCKDSISRKEFQSLLKEIIKISEDRNKIIHTISGVSMDGNALMVSMKMMVSTKPTNKKGLAASVSIASKEEIDKIAESILELADKLISIVLEENFPSSLEA